MHDDFLPFICKKWTSACLNWCNDKFKTLNFYIYLYARTHRKDRVIFVVYKAMKAILTQASKAVP